jgi:putative resolvase
MDKMMSIQKVSKMIGVTVKTLKLWDREGKLKAKIRTVGGHRRYSLSDIESFLNRNESNQKKENKNVFVYCRVSTKKQQDAGNLERQKERLSKYCTKKGYNVLGIYEEVASGLNDNRRELIKMFRRIDEVEKVVVEYNDRLARVGFNYLKEFCKFSGIEIEAVEQKTKLEPDEEMVNDLVSIVTCFSARLYGARGGRKIKQTLLELEKERSQSCENNHSSGID